jgi:hypothetical protein
MAAINQANYFLDAPADFNSIVCEQEAVYTPHQAEESILYGVVAENPETFYVCVIHHTCCLPPAATRATGKDQKHFKICDGEYSSKILLMDCRHAFRKSDGSSRTRLCIPDDESR